MERCKALKTTKHKQCRNHKYLTPDGYCPFHDTFFYRQPREKLYSNRIKDLSLFQMNSEKRMRDEIKSLTDVLVSQMDDLEPLKDGLETLKDGLESYQVYVALSMFMGFMTGYLLMAILFIYQVL